MTQVWLTYEHGELQLRACTEQNTGYTVFVFKEINSQAVRNTLTNEHHWGRIDLEVAIPIEVYLNEGGS